MLKRLLEKRALVVAVPIATLFVSAILFGLYGTWLAVQAVAAAVTDPSRRGVMEFVPSFFGVVDVYLLTVVLYVFAVGLYELFIGKLDVPGWLSIETLDELKAKLASVVILFVAIAFVKYLVDFRNPTETLMFGDAFTLELAPGDHRLKTNNTLFWKTVAFTIRPGEHAEFVLINRSGPVAFGFLALLGAAPLRLTVERRAAAGGERSS